MNKDVLIKFVRVLLSFQKKTLTTVTLLDNAPVLTELLTASPDHWAVRLSADLDPHYLGNRSDNVMSTDQHSTVTRSGLWRYA